MGKKGRKRFKMTKRVQEFEPQKIILKPIVTEKAIKMIHEQNKLIFAVVRTANRPMIKRAIEELFDVKVEKVNTLITPKGEKRAIVKLAEGYSAIDVATSLGIL